MLDPGFRGGHPGGVELARGVLHFGSGEGFGGPSSAAKIFHSALGEGLEGGEAHPISKASGTSISSVTGGSESGRVLGRERPVDD